MRNFNGSLDLQLEPRKEYRPISGGVKPAQPYLVIYGRRVHIRQEDIDGLIDALQEIRKQF